MIKKNTSGRFHLKAIIDGHEFSGDGPADAVSKQFNEFLAMVADVTSKRYDMADTPHSDTQ